ncbi:hypothetical protein PQX77_006140 [Marasmius sp. AFHP31]|nr:hypothetical protein PQX77_006140 [Marasmius sp. AFHP31]
MTLADTTTICAASVDHGSPERLVISHLDAPYSPDLTVFPCYSDQELDDLPLQYPYSSPESSQSSSESSYESIFVDLRHLLETRSAEIFSSSSPFVSVEDRFPTGKPAVEGSYHPHTFLKGHQSERGQENRHHLDSPSPFLPVLPSKVLEGFHPLRDVLRTPAASPTSNRQTCLSPSHRISPFADIANIVPPPSTPFDKALDIFSDLLSSTSGSPVIHRSPSASPIARRSDPVQTNSKDAFTAWIASSSPCSSVGSGPALQFSPRDGNGQIDKTPTRTTPASSARPSMSPLTPISDVPETQPEVEPKLKISLKLTAGHRRNLQKRKADEDYTTSPCEAKRTRCSLRQLLRETRNQAEDNNTVTNIPVFDVPMEQEPERPSEDVDCDRLPAKLSKKRRVASPPSTSTSTLRETTPLPSATHVPDDFQQARTLASTKPSNVLSYGHVIPSDIACSSPFSLFGVSNPGGSYNPPKGPYDLYTPRFVKGKGRDKVGLCPICIEPVGRGGEGRQLWLAMKFSAYKWVSSYHMQYAHGISASSALPFLPPLSFRVSKRPRASKTEKTEIKEGKCHQCHKWVPVEGVKDMEVKVKEIFWWKHAAACHSSSSTNLGLGDQGFANVFEEDEVFRKLEEKEGEMEIGPSSS